MKTPIRSFLIMVLLLLGSIQTVLANDYFENHIDWATYCMRASNITITKSGYEEIIARNNVSQELADLSNIVIKKDHRNETFKEWDIYEGSLYADIQTLPSPAEITDKVSRTIVFYMEKGNRTKNYIGVIVTIVPNHTSGGYDKPSGTTKPENQKPSLPADSKVPDEEISNTGGTELKKVEITNNVPSSIVEGEKEHKSTFLTWLLSGEEIPIVIPILGITINMTPLSLTQSSISGFILLLVFLLLINDIRMLVKYKRDKEKYICTRYK